MTTPTTALESAFLAALCEAPDDDTPRLIFADWLEEHGQPERAEFIRIQCELATLPSFQEVQGIHKIGCSADMTILLSSQRRRALDLEDHQRKLLSAANSIAWGPDRMLWDAGMKHPIQSLEFIPELLPGYVGTRYRRGFVSEITLLLADWIEHGRTLVRAAPLRVVRLNDREPMEGGQQLTQRDSEDWTWWQGDSDFHTMSNLPDVIYSAMGSLYKDFGGKRESRCYVFSSKQLALDCLSAACLAWARASD